MKDYSLGPIEEKFADIIWQKEPIASGDLVKEAFTAFEWKKSTTYTVLKRLCEKGIFQNEHGTVTSLISKNDFCAAQSEKFVEDTFNGSLPAFFAAFTGRKKLSDNDIDQLQELIDKMRR